MRSFATLGACPGAAPAARFGLAAVFLYRRMGRS
jgi:hypothetical protein